MTNMTRLTGRTALLLSAFLGVGCGDTTTPNPTADMAALVDLSTLATTDLTTLPDMVTAPDMATCGTITPGGPQAPTITAACKACGMKSCCAQMATCSSDADCAALRTCYDTCGYDDTNCVNACATAHMAGATDSTAVTTCRNTNCAADCANTTCQGKVTWAQPTMQTYSLAFTFMDYESGMPIVGATAKVCALADVNCANPTQTATSDNTGTVMLTIPSAPGTAAAYVEMSAASYMTTLNYLYLTPDQTLSMAKLTTTVLSTSLYGTFGQIVLGKAPDPTRGAAVFEVFQCVGAHLPGASVTASSADASSKEAYLAGGFPSTTATMTDSTGTGGVFNLPVGMTTLTTTFGGMPYGTATVAVRAGAVTALNLVPTP